MKIIPAIDIIDGKCVRLSKGDYNTQKIYNEDPLEIAKAFEDSGICYLHLVDLDGAKSNHIVNHKVLEAISTKTKLKIDFGGGLKTNDDLLIAFESGANQIVIGSVAVKQPHIFSKWLSTYGPAKIILGADVKGDYIATNGWLETSDKSLFDFLSFYEEQGLQTTICTDIDKDGMLEGPSFKLYEKIIKKTEIQLIASGGISKYDELIRLAAIGCKGAIIGKAIYENRISLNQLTQFILNKG